MIKSIPKNKISFLEDEIWILAWGAASQRGNIFSKSLSNSQKVVERNYIKKAVFKILEELKYSKNITENILMEKIEFLVESYSSSTFNFNVGHSQKLINILLKYYWVLGWLKSEPPHCPIDRIVLSKAKIKINGKIPSWTKMKDIDEYKYCIKKIKKFAYPISIACWELEIFRRRN